MNPRTFLLIILGLLTISLLFLSAMINASSHNIDLEIKVGSFFIALIPLGLFIYIKKKK